MLNIQQEIAQCYQPLFDIMQQEHGVILTVGEMDEIIKAATKVIHNTLMWATEPTFSIGDGWE